MNKKTLFIIFIVFMSLFLIACGNKNVSNETKTNDGNSASKDSPMIIRLGHGGASGDVLYQSVDVMSEYVKEHTDGRYIIENYGSSQLGNERDLIEGVTLGTVDMTLVTNAPLGNFVQEALFYDLPGLYKNLEHVHRVADSPIVQEYFAEKTLEKNLRLLAVTDGGFRNITNNVRPIYTLDDLEGISMRVQESPLIMATYSALPGISPTPIPIGELYTALEQGIVDAQENPSLLIHDFKFFEVQKYMTLTGHSYFPRHVFINENLWQKIPEEDQQVFIEGAAKLQEFKNNFYEEKNNEMIEVLKEEGMEVNEPNAEFKTEFFKIMEEQVYPQFYGQIGGGDEEKGKEIINSIIELGKDL